jgi:dephospho-CoA kinase
MLVLLTGMSGTGKSAVVRELRRRGCVAYDADDDGYTEPGTDGVWHWRKDAVTELLAGCDERPLFFAGCSQEQVHYDWDLKILLTAPEAVILERLATRDTNSYGKSVDGRERVIADLREVEPLLRASADVTIETTADLAHVTDRVLLATAGSELSAD